MIHRTDPEEDEKVEAYIQTSVKIRYSRSLFFFPALKVALIVDQNFQSCLESDGVAIR